MTIEIRDRTDFADKFAALMAANVSLTTAGIEPSRDLSKQMIEEFLDQFVIATPMPATPKSAGFIITESHTGTIPFDFRGHLYNNEALALLGIENFLAGRDYGKISDYRIIEATYFA